MVFLQTFLAVIGSNSLGEKKMHHFFRDTVLAPPRPSFLILDEFSTIGWLVVHLYTYTQLIFPLGIGDSGKERRPPTLNTFFGHWLKHVTVVK